MLVGTEASLQSVQGLESPHEGVWRMVALTLEATQWCPSC